MSNLADEPLRSHATLVRHSGLAKRPRRGGPLMNVESVPAQPTPETPPLAPHDPPEPAQGQSTDT